MRRTFLIIMFLILSSGCATSPPVLPFGDKFVSPRTGEFDKIIGIYKNNEIGFKIWFPSGYEIWIEESLMKQFAKGAKWTTGSPLLLGSNERDWMYVLIWAKKTPSSINDFFNSWKSTNEEVPIHQISLKEKQIGEINSIEFIYSGKHAVTADDVTIQSYFFDLNGYKIFIGLSTPTNFYNQRRIDKIKEIMNSFKNF